MQLIPSIDLLDGRLVRLRCGDAHHATFYDRSPESWIDQLCAGGAGRIHLVDLDGALRAESSTQTFELAASLPRRFPRVSFQFGGGLRTAEAIERVLDVGLEAVVGTLAVDEPVALAGLSPKAIIVALDLREGEIATRGWLGRAGRPKEDIFAALLAMGIRRALVTDIARDGTLSGPGLEAVAGIAGAGFRVQASGGVRSLIDVSALASIPGVVGAIAGRALLEGSLRLDDPAVRVVLGAS